MADENVPLGQKFYDNLLLLFILGLGMFALYFVLGLVIIFWKDFPALILFISRA